MSNSAKQPNGMGRTAVYFVLPALFLVAAGVWFFVRRQLQPEGGLAIEQDSLNIGEIWADRRLRHTLSLRNTSVKTIRILDISAPCRCVSIEPRKLAIPPGATRNITAVLDLRPTSAADAEKPKWPFSVDLYPVVDAEPPQRLRWRLVGTVRNSVTVTPPVLHWQLIRGERLRAQSLSVTCRKPDVASLTAAVDPSKATVSIIPPEGNDTDGRYTIRVAPSRSLPVGHFDFRVKLQATDSRGASVPAPSIHVSGIVLSNVRVTPGHLSLGRLRVNESQTHLVLVSSRTSKPLRAIVAEFQAAAGLRVERLKASATPDGSVAFRVVQSATGPGDHQTTVRFFDGPKGESRSRVGSLTIFYHGWPQRGANTNDSKNHGATSLHDQPGRRNSERSLNKSL